MPARTSHEYRERLAASDPNRDRVRAFLDRKP
jgi:hypothetical protein